MEAPWVFARERRWKRVPGVEAWADRRSVAHRAEPVACARSGERRVAYRAVERMTR